MKILKKNMSFTKKILVNLIWYYRHVKKINKLYDFSYHIKYFREYREDMFWEYYESDRKKTKIEDTFLELWFYYVEYKNYVREIQSDRGLSKVRDGVWEDKNWGYWEFTYTYWFKIPASMIKSFIKYKVLKIKYVDPHIACYSYPNCDEAPSGCNHIMGQDAEPYGHRD
tara:strand:- start:3044 stop:3550 length:507 start_codon:yes stop_codon:yes gene_type:complete